MLHILTAHEIRQIAALAAVDPRTIRQYFAGRARSTTAARIKEALRQLGYKPVPPAPPTDTPEAATDGRS